MTPREAAIAYVGEDQPAWVVSQVERAIRLDREARRDALSVPRCPSIVPDYLALAGSRCVLHEHSEDTCHVARVGDSSVAWS